MEKVFYSLRVLDRRAEKEFKAGNGILMENAARGSAEKLKSLFLQNERLNKGKKILQIVCGSGDNGGDGLALARMCADFFNVIAVCIKEPKSELCRLQKERLEALGITVKKTIETKCDILFDAFLGTGLKGVLNNEDKKIIERLNKLNCIKIACDIPSGLNAEGIASPVAVNCDCTFSMGALKTAFFSDFAKDVTGKIEVIDLGIPRSKYETETEVFLLNKSDMILPVRKRQNTHKRSFGHAAVILGEKPGACILAASAALKFGAGLLTVSGGFKDGCPSVSSFKKLQGLPADFMYSENFNCKEFSAAAIGCGLGKSENKNTCGFSILLDKKTQKMPLVLDADIFYYEKLKEVLPNLKKAVLTPHPKEFSFLLKICGFGNYSVNEIQQNRFKLLNEFCKRYPDLTVLLKGANVLIGSNGKIFINSLGSSSLSKAGTGDVLAGIITALLAQGYSPEEAAISGSLAHTLAGGYSKSSYGLTASGLIAGLEKLESFF